MRDNELASQLRDLSAKVERLATASEQARRAVHSHATCLDGFELRLLRVEQALARSGLGSVSEAFAGSLEAGWSELQRQLAAAHRRDAERRWLSNQVSRIESSTASTTPNPSAKETD